MSEVPGGLEGAWTSPLGGRSWRASTAAPRASGAGAASALERDPCAPLSVPSLWCSDDCVAWSSGRWTALFGTGDATRTFSLESGGQDTASCPRGPQSVDGAALTELAGSESLDASSLFRAALGEFARVGARRCKCTRAGLESGGASVGARALLVEGAPDTRLAVAACGRIAMPIAAENSGSSGPPRRSADVKRESGHGPFAQQERRRKDQK